METCNICYEDEANCSLNCDHKVCKSCYAEINLCPFCRRSILRLDRILNPIMKEYHRMNDIDLGFTENDTFANFLFYHEYWGASEMFKHKANLTRMDLYNPYVYDNHRLICSGKYIHEPIRYIKRVKNVRKNKVLNDE